SPSVTLILLHICNYVSISFDAIMMEMGMISLKQMDRVFIKPAADLAKRRQCDANARKGPEQIS
ncbi:unnamed protein product, partial [Brassica oleracea]